MTATTTAARRPAARTARRPRTTRTIRGDGAGRPAPGAAVSKPWRVPSPWAGTCAVLMPTVGVVMATRARRARVLDALTRLTALPERPPLVLVDNGSRDGTADAAAAAFPDLDVVRAGRNLGGAARAVGAARLTTDHVAFA